MDRSFPNFKLTIDGSALSDELKTHVVSIQFVDSQDELDAMHVTLVVPQTADRESIVSFCKVGVEAELELGYGDSLDLTWTGDVVSLRHAWSDSSNWTVTISAIDQLERLRTAREKVWEDGVTDVIEKIAGEAGFGKDVQGVQATTSLLFQNGIDDLTFVKNLADEFNYFVRVLDKKLFFGRKAEASMGGKTTVTYGEDLVSVEWEANLKKVFTEVNVTSYNSITGEAIAGVSDADVSSPISGGDTGPTLAGNLFGKRVFYETVSTSDVQSSADEKAKAIFEGAAETFLRGSLTCLGNPAARSGGDLEIKKAPHPFSGTFKIIKAVHSYDPETGYLTTIGFMSNSLPSE